MNDQDQPTGSDNSQQESDDQASQNPKYMDFVRSGSINQAMKPIQKSQTLMRSVVSNQASTKSPAITTSLPVANNAGSSGLISHKTSVSTIDESMLNRAKNVTKSDFVSRFSDSSALSQIVNEPEAESLSTPAPEESVSESSNQPSMNIFDQGIATATAHNMPPLSPEKSTGSKKLVGILSASLLVVIAAGFLINLNVNKIDVYLAASKAGFSATTPSISPSGYSLSKVSSAAGVISTFYQSNSDTRNYTITERSSLWDSSTLFDSYVAEVAGSNYQTVQSRGITIYIYGNRNAAWVNNGIWYVISNNNSLSNAQLINIATSM